MYLFEKILLCCKEIGTSKKGKISTKPAPPPTRNGKPRMALKGRIFMSNVSEVNFANNKGKFLAMKIGSKEKVRAETDDVYTSRH
jgi:cell division control protein 24